MFNTSKTTIVRAAIQLAVGVSTYAVTSAVIKNNVSDPDTKAQKAALAVGSYVLGHMVANEAGKYVDASFVEIMEGLRTIKSDVADVKDQK